MYTISFWTKDNNKEVVRKVQPMQTILEVGLNNGIIIPHVCGGVCHCTTCHVYVEKGMAYLEKPSKRETDFLKRVDKRTENSRLSCQSLLLDGRGEIEIMIPKT